MRGKPQLQRDSATNSTACSDWLMHNVVSVCVRNYALIGREVARTVSDQRSGRKAGGFGIWHTKREGTTEGCF
jgi:hypothetical protein